MVRVPEDDAYASKHIAVLTIYKILLLSIYIYIVTIFWFVDYICFWRGFSYMIDISYSFYNLFTLLFKVSYIYIYIVHLWVWIIENT